MKARSSLATALAGMLLLATFVWFAGSRNPVTPAGYVGYLTQGAVLGKTRYYGLQKGPTSSGRTWLLNVENIIQVWIETAREIGRPIPEPKGRLLFA